MSALDDTLLDLNISNQSREIAPRFVRTAFVFELSLQGRFNCHLE
jgi:hypothetical protein